MAMQASTGAKGNPRWVRFAVIFGIGFALAFGAASLARADAGHLSGAHDLTAEQ